MNGNLSRQDVRENDPVTSVSKGSLFNGEHTTGRPGGQLRKDLRTQPVCREWGSPFHSFFPFKYCLHSCEGCSPCRPVIIVGRVKETG